MQEEAEVCGIKLAIMVCVNLLKQMSQSFRRVHPALQNPIAWKSSPCITDYNCLAEVTLHYRFQLLGRVHPALQTPAAWQSSPYVTGSSLKLPVRSFRGVSSFGKYCHGDREGGLMNDT